MAWTVILAFFPTLLRNSMAWIVILAFFPIHYTFTDLIHCFLYNLFIRNHPKENKSKPTTTLKTQVTTTYSEKAAGDQYKQPVKKTIKICKLSQNTCKPNYAENYLEPAPDYAEITPNSLLIMQKITLNHIWIVKHKHLNMKIKKYLQVAYILDLR